VPPVLTEHEDGWAPEPVWTLWRKEKACIAGNQTRVVQPVAILTEISRLLITTTMTIIIIISHKKRTINP
jgi:hypothetical protein